MSSRSTARRSTTPSPTPQRFAALPPSKEWDPLTSEELQVCSHLSGCSWPEQNFGDIPVDLLVCFVRGYAHEANWAGETRRLLADALRWRSKERADSAIASGPPARRVQWEAAWPSGPIGHDREGRAVVVDRIGQIIPRSCADFDEEAFLQHALYSKEAARTYCRALSHKGGRRVYKVVQIVDLAGFGMQHTGGEMLKRYRTYFATFAETYPEFMTTLIVINAPAIFSGLWNVMKNLLDAEVVAKVSIFGSDKQKQRDELERHGITLDGPLATTPVSWLRTIEGLETPCPPPFVPVEDRHALAALAALSSAAAAAADAPPDAFDVPSTPLQTGAITPPTSTAPSSPGGPVCVTARAQRRARTAARGALEAAAADDSDGGANSPCAVYHVEAELLDASPLLGPAATRSSPPPLSLPDAPARRSSGLDSPPPTFPTLESRWVRADGGDGGAFTLNSRAAEPFETDLFEGKLLVMLRPPDSAADDPHYHRRLFSIKQRRCEVQLQGRFKRPPGKMYIGGEIDTPAMNFGMVTKSFAKLLLNIMQAKVRLLHYSFGAEGGAEAPHIALPLRTSADTFISTPKGEAPPALGQLLEEWEAPAARAARRAAASSDRYEWDLGATYTFTFHSMYFDLPSWKGTAIPGLGGRTIDLHSFWGDAAFRLAVYESRAPDKAPHRWRENEYLLRVALRHRR